MFAQHWLCSKSQVGRSLYINCTDFSNPTKAPWIPRSYAFFLIKHPVFTFAIWRNIWSPKTAFTSDLTSRWSPADSITQFKKKTKTTFYLDCTFLSMQQLLSLNILCNQMCKKSLYLSLCGHAHSLQTGLKVLIGKLSFYTARRNRGFNEDAS